jgi:hypothetical protein
MSYSSILSVTRNLLITEQSEQIQELKEIVRSTEQVRIPEAEGKLPTIANRRWRRASFSN